MKRSSSAPELKPKRMARRRRERAASQRKEEKNRRRAIGGGQPNELGVIQGQNAEQGNTINPRQAEPVAHPPEH